MVTESRSFEKLLSVSLPETFAADRRPLLAALEAQVDLRRPWRVLEYGLGETPGLENGVGFGALASAIAEKTGGGCRQVVFSDSARRRVPLESSVFPRTLEISRRSTRRTRSMRSGLSWTSSPCWPTERWWSSPDSTRLRGTARSRCTAT